MYKKIFLTIVCFCIVCSFLQTQDLTVPGTVISHVPQTSGCYIGSPSICILPNGDYIASHDLFEPQSNEFQSAHTWVFKSTDKGKTWEKMAEINRQFWSTVFNIGNDIIFVSRTAYDDETGGAHNNHDANYMTFHRVHNFRNLLSKQLQ